MTKLLERYIHEVGRHLPRKGHDDIVAELRSSLQDKLEDRFGSEASEENLVTLLKEFGSPEEVAASYTPPRYLIGPALYPYYSLVIQIGLWAMAPVWLMIAFFSLNDSTDLLRDLWPVAREVGSGYLQGALWCLGTTTFVFALLERLAIGPTGEDKEEEPKEWSPRDLPPVNDPDAVSRVGETVSIGFSILFLILLNAFQDRIGIVLNPMAEPISIPLLTAYVPWISLLVVLSIALSVTLLQQGRWQIVTRLAKIGLNLFGAVVFYRLFVDLSEWAAQQSPTSIFAILGMVFSWVPVVIVIGTVIDTLQILYRMVRGALRVPRSSQTSVGEASRSDM